MCNLYVPNTISECPYEVYMRDSGSVRAEGPGLESGAVNVVAHFTVLMAGAGRGELDVLVTGPCPLSPSDAWLRPSLAFSFGLVTVRVLSIIPNVIAVLSL